MAEGRERSGRTGGFMGNVAKPGAGRYLLKRGRDLKKDQSYFLFATTQEQLDFLRFPLGGWTKDVTRAQAQRLGRAFPDETLPLAAEVDALLQARSNLDGTLAVRCSCRAAPPRADLRAAWRKTAPSCSRRGPDSGAFTAAR